MGRGVLIVVDISGASEMCVFDAARQLTSALVETTDCALVVLSTTIHSVDNQPFTRCIGSRDWGATSAVLSQLESIQKQYLKQASAHLQLADDWPDILGRLLDCKDNERSINIVLLGHPNSSVWQPDSFLGLWLAHHMKSINNDQEKLQDGQAIGVVVHAVNAGDQPLPASHRSGSIEALCSEYTHVCLYDNIDLFIVQLEQAQPLWCGTLNAGMVDNSVASNSSENKDRDKNKIRRQVDAAGLVIRPCLHEITSHAAKKVKCSTPRRSERNKKSTLTPTPSKPPITAVITLSEPRWLLHEWGTMRVLHAASKTEIQNFQHLMGHELGELQCQDPLVYPQTAQLITDLCHQAASDCALVCCLERGFTGGGASKDVDGLSTSQLLVLFAHQNSLLVRRVLNSSEMERVCGAVLDSAALPRISLQSPPQDRVNEMKANLQSLMGGIGTARENTIGNDIDEEEKGYDSLCASDTDPLCSAPTRLRSVSTMETILLQSLTAQTKATGRGRGQRISVGKTTSATALRAAQEARQRTGPLSQLVRLIDQDDATGQTVAVVVGEKRRKIASWKQLRQDYGVGVTTTSSSTHAAATVASAAGVAGVEYASFHNRGNNAALQNVTRNIDTNHSLIDSQHALWTSSGARTKHKTSSGAFSGTSVGSSTGVGSSAGVGSSTCTSSVNRRRKSNSNNSKSNNNRKLLLHELPVAMAVTAVSSRSKRAASLAQQAPPGEAQQPSSRMTAPYESKRSRLLNQKAPVKRSNTSQAVAAPVQSNICSTVARQHVVHTSIGGNRHINGGGGGDGNSRSISDRAKGYIGGCGGRYADSSSSGTDHSEKEKRMAIEARIKQELSRTLPKPVVNDPQRMRVVVESANTMFSAFLQMPAVLDTEAKLQAKIKSTCAFVMKEFVSVEDLLGGVSSDEGD